MRQSKGIARLPGTIIVGAFLAMALAVSAETAELTVGNNIDEGGYLTKYTGPRTYFDTTKPATGTGFIEEVRLQWDGYPCDLEVVVLRRRGDLFVVVERRSVTTTSWDGVITFGEPVPIQQGDYIGISRPAASCGSPAVASPPGSGALFSTPGRPDQFSVGETERYDNAILALFGRGPATLERAGVIPVVTQAPGNFGSFFRTSFRAIQLPGHADFHGAFVFRPDLVPGETEEHTVAFDLEEGKQVNWKDLVGQLGASGAGSVEIFAPPGGELPEMFVEIYDDKDPGRSGSEIDVVDPRAPARPGRPLLSAITGGYLFPPTRDDERMNIGIKALDEGAEGTFERVSTNGVTYYIKGYFTVPPRTLVQLDWRQLVVEEYPEIKPLRVTVWKGSAIVYQSTIDNTTNDSTIRVVRASHSAFGWEPECPE